MRQVDRLYQLQRIDDRIAQYERELEMWAKRRQEVEQALAAIRADQQAHQETLHRKEQRLREAEWTLKDMEKQVQKMNDRLYSKAIRSAKEAAALQAEIEQTRERRAALEDETLQLMIELDELGEELEEIIAKEERRVVEQKATAQQAAGETKALQEEIQDQQEAREEVAAQVDPDALQLYEQLREKGGGMAVARVVDNVCEGCHLEVAVLTRKAARGDELVRCEICGRILYVP